ncbi:ATP-dependent DNA helicase [Mycena venus]|uniref:ATP-dependent DNA helicase n=1 Tax=Mycena venus TaxID=2733690 RepID=A0A8H6Z7P0_9AGAR|nr:ATP-dependent DNA helicase [Mycena venus]
MALDPPLSGLSDVVDTSHVLGRSCTCDEPSACRCPSTSGCIPSAIPMNKMTSLNLLRDILLGHHLTRSHIAVFYAGLPTIQRSLDLHAISHVSLTLIQCRRLLHHIMTGACGFKFVSTAGVFCLPCALLGF